MDIMLRDDAEEAVLSVVGKSREESCADVRPPTRIYGRAIWSTDHLEPKTAEPYIDKRFDLLANILTKAIQAGYDAQQKLPHELFQKTTMGRFVPLRPKEIAKRLARAAKTPKA